MSELQIADQGTIILIPPLNEAACQWLDENVVSAPWQWVFVPGKAAVIDDVIVGSEDAVRRASCRG
jgi:hypothetical protein